MTTGLKIKEVADASGFTAATLRYYEQIQDQLRQLVAGKIAAAQNQIAELVTFSAELQRAATALERHRPDGACDADCGCVSGAIDTEPLATKTQSVSVSAKPSGSGWACDRMRVVGCFDEGPDRRLAIAARPRGTSGTDRRWRPIRVHPLGADRCRSVT